MHSSELPHYMTPRTPRTPRAHSKSVGLRTQQKTQKRQQSPPSTGRLPKKTRPDGNSVARRLGPLQVAPSEPSRCEKFAQVREARKKRHETRLALQTPPTLLIGGLNPFNDSEPVKSWKKLKELLNIRMGGGSASPVKKVVPVFRPDDSLDDDE